MHTSRDASSPFSASSNSSSSGEGRSDGDAQHTAATTKAAEDTGAPPRSELQRRRHRENMSRYRNKKKNTIEDMRVREQVLAAQVQSMLQLHAAQSPTYGPDEQERHSESSWQRADPIALSTRRSPTPMDAYVRSLTQREQLEHENAALRQRVAEFQNFQEVVQEATATETTQSAQRSISGSRPGATRLTKVAVGDQSSEDDNDPGYWIQFVENEAPFYYVPLTDAQCSSMVAETLRQVFAFQTLNVVDKHPVEAHVLRFFEWTASLTFEWDEDAHCRMMRYQFCKTFRNPARSMAETEETQWGVLHDSVMYQKIHSVPVKLRILQRVDEETTVMMVTAPDATQSLKYRSVSILSRRDYQSPEGSVGRIVVMAKQRLDLSTQVTSRGEQVVYTSGGFLHVIYMPRESTDGQRGMDIEYGGRIPLPSEAQARFLMVDIGNALIRLESLLFPFRVLR